MAKKSEFEVLKDELKKTNKVLLFAYALIIVVTIGSLTVGNSGCCDCSQCNACCCCDTCVSAGCRGDCGCVNAGLEGTRVIDPYSGKSVSGAEYWCDYKSMPPTPGEPECDCGSSEDCPLQEGVCEGAVKKCCHKLKYTEGGGYDCACDKLFMPEWQACNVRVYREQAEDNGYPDAYQADEDLCDGLDNDCDGEKDEGCDEDKDGYCSEDYECTGTEFNCVSGECKDCDDSNALINTASQEVCDAAGVDENCNRLANEGCQCSPVGSEMPCPKTQGVCAEVKNICMDCSAADSTCLDTLHKSEWSACQYGMIEEYKSTEAEQYYCADGLDNDCDGKADCNDPGCGNFCMITPP